MTNNELKPCPVCGKKAYENEEGFMNCTNINCSYIDDMHIDDFESLSTFIQSRIDAAVQEAKKTLDPVEEYCIECINAREVTFRCPHCVLAQDHSGE